jgi:hypothetical protein
MKITDVHGLLKQTFPGATWAYGAPGAGVTQSHEVTHKIGCFEIRVLAVGDLPDRTFVVRFTVLIQNKKVEIFRSKMSTDEEVEASIHWIEEYLRGIHIALLTTFREQL